MKQWIKLEIDLMDDPRIKKLLDSNLGFAGFGIYVFIRMIIENNINKKLHVNQIVTIGNGRLRPTKIYSVLNDFKLFWLNGDGSVVVREPPRACVSADASADAPADVPADEPNKDIYIKEINKEILEEENGNHDFDPRWI